MAIIALPASDVQSPPSARPRDARRPHRSALPGGEGPLRIARGVRRSRSGDVRSGAAKAADAALRGRPGLFAAGSAQYVHLSAARCLEAPAGDSSPPDTFDQAEDVRAVKPEARIEAAELYALISTLPPDFRDAVVAIDLVGLSYNQAARALRVREATIATRLHRGRRAGRGPFVRANSRPETAQPSPDATRAR